MRRHLPEGSVFVVVIDPSIEQGAQRRGIAVALANGRYLVGPDNGVLSWPWRAGASGPSADRETRPSSARTTRPPRPRRLLPRGRVPRTRIFPPFAEIGPEQKDWVKLPANKVERTATSSARSSPRSTPLRQPLDDIRIEDLAPTGSIPSGTRLRFVLGDKRDRRAAGANVQQGQGRRAARLLELAPAASRSPSTWATPPRPTRRSPARQRHGLDRALVASGASYNRPPLNRPQRAARHRPDPLEHRRIPHVLRQAVLVPLVKLLGDDGELEQRKRGIEKNVPRISSPSSPHTASPAPCAADSPEGASARTPSPETPAGRRPGPSSRASSPDPCAGPRGSPSPSRARSRPSWPSRRLARRCRT